MGRDIPPAALGLPNTSKQGIEAARAHKWARCLHDPSRLGGSPTLQGGGTESEVAHKRAGWLHNPCAEGGPNASKHRSMGTQSQVALKWANGLHNPYRMGGSPTLHNGGQNQKWPTSGAGGYITPAAWRVTNAAQLGNRIGNGPRVGWVAT